MGNEGSTRSPGKHRHEKDPRIGIEISCPGCTKVFSPRTKQSEVHHHINSCLKERFYQEEAQSRRLELMREMQPNRN